MAEQARLGFYVLTQYLLSIIPASSFLILLFVFISLVASNFGARISRRMGAQR